MVFKKVIVFEMSVHPSTCTLTGAINLVVNRKLSNIAISLFLVVKITLYKMVVYI